MKTETLIHDYNTNPVKVLQDLEGMGAAELVAHYEDLSPERDALIQSLCELILNEVSKRLEDPAQHNDLYNYVENRSGGMTET